MPHNLREDTRLLSTPRDRSQDLSFCRPAAGDSAGQGIWRQLIGAKLTGAERYRDVLSKDADADLFLDLVDVVLPSTAGPTDEYSEALRKLLTIIDEAGADVVMAEAGASPLEPYNAAPRSAP